MKKPNSILKLAEERADHRTPSRHGLPPLLASVLAGASVPVTNAPKTDSASICFLEAALRGSPLA